MSKPRGLDHFAAFFKDYQANYVVVGGAGLSVLMDEDGLKFRKTTDLDIVLLTKTSVEFNNRIAAYVEEGGYKTKEATAEAPRYYRFLEPTDEKFPEELEFFSNNENEIELRTGQYIVPVATTEGSKISAILLDDLYFGIIQSNLTKGSEFSVLSPVGQICLKSRAYREIKSRGEDSKKSDKHRNDIVRISQMLSGEHLFTLKDHAKKDFEDVLSEITQNVDERAIQQITDNKMLKKADVLSVLKKTFGL